MNKASSNPENRRLHPRINNNIPIKLYQENGDIVTETGNISRAGSYCKVNSYVEPMTKLKVQLMLPMKKAGKNTSKKITCEGVVVRTEEIKNEEGYYIAIFFNDISQRDAECIADYVNSFIDE